MCGDSSPVHSQHALRTYLPADGSMYLITPMDPLFLVLDILSGEPRRFSLLEQLFAGVAAAVKRPGMPTPGVTGSTTISGSSHWDSAAVTWVQTALPSLVQPTLPLIMDVNGALQACFAPQAHNKSRHLPQIPWVLMHLHIG